MQRRKNRGSECRGILRGRRQRGTCRYGKARTGSAGSNTPDLPDDLAPHLEASLLDGTKRRGRRDQRVRRNDQVSSGHRDSQRTEGKRIEEAVKPHHVVVGQDARAR